MGFYSNVLPSVSDGPYKKESLSCTYVVLIIAFTKFHHSLL